MLEVGELGAGVGGGGFARVEDLGAEFGASGAEEVGFLKEKEERALARLRIMLLMGGKQ